MKSLDSFKYAIFNEWTDDPPAGSITFYYDAIFEEADEVGSIIDEIVEHIKDATGYEGLDSEELDNEDYQNEMKGLYPGTENGVLTPDGIKNWSWDNGGAGCGCVAYAEGVDIIDAAINFYEETFEDIDAIGFDEDDEGNLLIEFPVTLSMCDGDGGDVVVIVPVTKEEFCTILDCCRKEIEIADCDELESLVSRIEDAAIEEAECAADELDDELDCSEMSFLITYPDEIVDIEDELKEGLASVEKELLFDKAQANPENVEAVMDMLKKISTLIEATNDSQW